MESANFRHARLMDTRKTVFTSLYWVFQDGSDKGESATQMEMDNWVDGILNFYEDIPVEDEKRA